jgi:long-chain acyl-CoA synthetase
LEKIMTDRTWLKSYDSEVPHHLKYPHITVDQMLVHAARTYPNNACTVFRDSVITYQQMDELSEHLADVFASLGICKGDRIALLMRNIPQFVLAYFAALKAGAVLVAMNPLYKPPEIIAQLNDANVKLLVVEEEFYPQVKAIQTQTPLLYLIQTHQDDLLSPSLEQIFASFKSADLSSAKQIEPVNFRLNNLLLHYVVSSRRPLNLTSEDVALFQYSGGTTGVSKAAVALHRNLVANALQFRHWLHLAHDGEETMLMVIPLYHVYGMVVGMLVAIQLGASLVMIPSPRDTDEILSNIQKYKPTLFPGVPNLYQAINQHPDVIAGKVDLSSIKACISGSAPLLIDTKKRFEALTGGKLVEGYGLSEAPTATHCNPINNENRSGSIGLPLPDVDCRIVDLDEGLTDLPINQPGELIIKGPQVMQGYHNMPSETALTLREGWLYTGDIARMDRDGYFYLVDRKKDLIKPGGFQVWPREVEEVLLRHPKVAEAAVAGIIDPHRGELVAAWVVLKPEAGFPENANQDELKPYYLNLEDELRRTCKEFLASYKSPAIIRFIDALPRSSVGKILRRELARQFNFDHSQDDTV